jgi:hypothetical protein
MTVKSFHGNAFTGIFCRTYSSSSKDPACPLNLRSCSVIVLRWPPCEWGAPGEQTASLDELFKGRHFDAEIIVLCVRWYLAYKLSYRDLAEMMVERGVSVAPSTIFRWVQRYAPEFEKRWNPSHAQSAARGVSMRRT